MEPRETSSRITLYKQNTKNIALKVNATKIIPGTKELRESVEFFKNWAVNNMTASSSPQKEDQQMTPTVNVV